MVHGREPDSDGVTGSVAGALARIVPEPLRRYGRAGPGTAALLSILLVAHGWLGHRADPGQVLAWVSTNTDNLARHPLGSLAGSLLFFGGTVTDAGSVITLGLGVAGALWWLEAHAGPARAGTVFLAGHVGATLLTAVVIAAAVRDGRYPPEVRSALDFGISYGAETVLAAVTVAVPRWARWPWTLFVLGWPLADSRWYGLLPDFTTVGHLISAALGFALGALLIRPALGGALVGRTTSSRGRRVLGTRLLPNVRRRRSR